MTWFFGLFVAATFVGSVVLIATAWRIVIAWRDYRREQREDAAARRD